MATKAQKLVEAYTEILDIANVVPDDHGLLSSDTTGVPITIDSKRVALPTKENLQRMVEDKLVIYHPLSENVFNGMSDVFLETRYMMQGKIHRIIVVRGLHSIETCGR